MTQLALNSNNLTMNGHREITIPQSAYSLEAESAVLGSILIDPSVLADVDGMITARDFWALKHEFIFSAMCALEADDVEIDIVTLADRFTDAELKEIGGRAYLVELTNNVPTSRNASYYAEIVRRAARRRDLLLASDELRKLAFDETLGIEQIIEATETRIDRLRATLPEPDERLAADGMEKALDYVEAVAARERLTYVPTGIHALDTVLCGGVGRGEVNVVIAQRHIGKTSLGFNIAANALASGHRVMFPTVEFGYDKLLRQFVAFKSGVPSAHFERGTANSDQYAKFMEASIWVGERPMHILAKQPITMHKIARRTRVLSRREKPLDIVIVDFIQGLSINRDPLNANWGIYQKMEYWTNALVNLAAECNVAMVIMAQANRRVNGRMPMMEDIEGGDYLAQRADVVIGMHRPKGEKGTLELGVHKNRISGEVTTVSATQEYGTRRIR